MCDSPFRLKDSEIDVPCGKCPKCRRRRADGWAFRLMQEEKRSFSAHFITLTYDTKFVPITQSGFMSVSKRDCQNFFKRLRKRVVGNSGESAIKYYLAAEYGGKTWRPHYHALVFNVANITDVDAAWNLGAVHYGKVTDASVGYTLKYMCKPKRVPAHRNDDRLPEFGLMSKGLGVGYL